MAQNNLYALPGESYKDYEKRLGAIVQPQLQSPGVGFGTPTNYATAPITADTATPQPDLSKQLTYPTPTSVPDLSKFYTTPPETLTTPETEVQKRLNDIINQQQDLSGEAAFKTQQETAQGLPELRQTQNDLLAQQRVLLNEATQIKLNAPGPGQGAMPTIQIQRDQAEKLRQNAVSSLGVGALLAASQGQIATANDLVDRAVAAKYNPIKDQINANLNNLNLILKSPDYTIAEKNRAQQQLDIQNQRKSLLDTATNNAKDIYRVSLEAATKGANAATLQKIQSATTPQEALQIFAASGVAQKAISATGENGIVNTGMPLGVTGEDVLKGVDSGTAGIVRQLVNYKIPLPSGFALKAPFWQRLLGLAAQYDPTFDATQYNVRLKLKQDFTSGKAATNIRALNTAVGHIQTLDEKANALQNASIPLWNKIANAGLTAVGDKRVVEFNSAATAVENELANVFKGTGATDQEVKAWRSSLDTSQSPQQLKGAIDTVLNLLGSRLQALENQYEVSVGKPKDFRFLSPESRDILSKLGVDVNSIDSVQGTSPTTNNTQNDPLGIR